MTELITLPQANHLMIAILIAAPLVGLVWGLIAKQVARYLTYGAVIGVGNFVLWNVYNTITDHLGLDTVKNLVVNLVLFVVLGVVAGVVIGRLNSKSAAVKSSEIAD